MTVGDCLSQEGGTVKILDFYAAFLQKDSDVLWMTRNRKKKKENKWEAQ